jgi:hypothetical protein
MELKRGGETLRRSLASFLCGSLALNLILAWACWSRLFAVPLVAPAIPPARPQPGSGPARAQGPVLTNLVSVTNAPRLFDWRALESDDYRQYIANLRRLQCPDKTVRDIIVADVNELYRHRFLQEFPHTNRVEYWKPGDALANVIKEDQVARLQEFGREKRELIRNLLGSDYTGDIELTSIQEEIFLDRLLDFLTPEKRSAMQELERRHTAKVMAAANSALRGDNASSKAVEQENDSEALKVLTPNEKLEYDLRRSNGAMYLRVALGDFELEEQEFRAVFPAMKEFIKDAGIQSLMLVVGGDGDPREVTQPARAQLESRVRAALGQKRFTELVEGTGWNLSNR